MATHSSIFARTRPDGSVAPVFPGGIELEKNQIPWSDPPDYSTDKAIVWTDGPNGLPVAHIQQRVVAADADLSEPWDNMNDMLVRGNSDDLTSGGTLSLTAQSQSPAPFAGLSIRSGTSGNAANVGGGSIGIGAYGNGLNSLRRLLDNRGGSDWLQISRDGAANGFEGAHNRVAIRRHDTGVFLSPVGVVTSPAFPVMPGGNYGCIIIHTAPFAHWSFRAFPRSSDIVVQNDGAAQNISFVVLIIGIPNI